MFNRLLGQYRRYLTNYESALAYALLGVVGGVASGLVVIAFEISIRQLALLWGVGAGGDGFEALPHWLLFALPALAAEMPHGGRLIPERLVRPAQDRAHARLDSRLMLEGLLVGRPVEQLAHRHPPAASAAALAGSRKKFSINSGPFGVRTLSG